MNAKRMLADRLESALRASWATLNTKRDKARAEARKAANAAALAAAEADLAEWHGLMAQAEIVEKRLRKLGLTNVPENYPYTPGRTWHLQNPPQFDTTAFDAADAELRALHEDIPFVLLGSKADEVRAAVQGFEAKLSAIVNPPESKPAPVKSRRRQPRMANNGGL